MDWTPLITAASFTGIRADVLTAVGGLLGLVFIVLGAGIIIKTMMNR